jgi:hypothetical protein
MQHLIRCMFFPLTLMLTLSLVGFNAAASTAYGIDPVSKYLAKKGDSGDNTIPSTCRQLALKIDWLGRYQDRPACTKNLDGTSVYFAGYYLENDRKEDAQKLLEEATVKINFAIEIGCYGQDDMKHVLVDLEKVIREID